MTTRDDAHTALVEVLWQELMCHQMNTKDRAVEAAEAVLAVVVSARPPCETCGGTGRIRYTSTHEAGGVIHHDNSCPQKCLDGLGPLPYILTLLGGEPVPHSLILDGDQRIAWRFSDG